MEPHRRDRPPASASALILEGCRPGRCRDRRRRRCRLQVAPAGYRPESTTDPAPHRSGVGSFIPPLSTVVESVGMRWRIRRPRVETVVPEPDRLPWADVGRLLARLHTEAGPPWTPAHGWPEGRRRAVDIARGHDVVRRAAAELPAEAWGPAQPIGRGPSCTATCISASSAGDRTDRGCSSTSTTSASAIRRGTSSVPLGLVAGLIPDADGRCFSTRTGRRRSCARPGEPWPVLEPFARASVVQAAAHHPDDELLIAACARMVRGVRLRAASRREQPAEPCRR